MRYYGVQIFYNSPSFNVQVRTWWFWASLFLIRDDELFSHVLLFRKLSLSDARAASRVEEDFQTDIWGIVEGGHDMDILNNSISLASVDTFLSSYWSDNNVIQSRMTLFKSV